MVEKAELLALAERCESAAGPDNDLRIAILTHPVFGYRDIHDRGNDGYWYTDEEAIRQLPDPTVSLDAAAALVPTKPFPEIRPGEWWWSVDSLGCDAHVAYENHDSGIPEYSASATTPALALTAAALRALADLSGQ